MAPNVVATNKVINISSSPGSFQFSQILEHPMIANKVWMNLTPSADQKSSYLELRGCNLEGKYFLNTKICYYINKLTIALCTLYILTKMSLSICSEF